VRVTRVQLRDFRNYEAAELEPSDGLTVIAGQNGAGKTNLLEAVYFGCTARSPRTANERELVRRGAGVTRVVVSTAADDSLHSIDVGFEPGTAKRLRVDGHAVDRLSTAHDVRPLASVFLPERLELVKGAPSARRGHLDQLVAALWPSRAATRSAYSRALAQRNALLARVCAGSSGPAALDAWDAEVAGHGVRLMEDRSEAVAGLAGPFAELAAELAARRAADLERGFTAHGPHRDELQLLLGGAALRAYGSQGQQRVALLALLFAERQLLAERRSTPPLMLLDDVMSELDAERRELLARLLRSGGQALVTTTEPEHVPGDVGALVTVEASRLRPRPRAVAA